MLVFGTKVKENESIKDALKRALDNEHILEKFKEDNDEFSKKFLNALFGDSDEEENSDTNDTVEKEDSSVVKRMEMLPAFVRVALVNYKKELEADRKQCISRVSQLADETRKEVTEWFIKNGVKFDSFPLNLDDIIDQKMAKVNEQTTITVNKFTEQINEIKAFLKTHQFEK